MYTRDGDIRVNAIWGESHEETLHHLFSETCCYGHTAVHTMGNLQAIHGDHNTRP